MIVRSLAQKGLQAQAGKTFEQARQEGDRCLDQITLQGGPEAEFARITRQAASNRLYNESAYKAQNAALKTLAAGLSGPLGQALALVGVEAMNGSVWHRASEAYSDGRTLGSTFLSGIENHSQYPQEKLLARTARQASSQRLYNESGFEAERTALQMIGAVECRQGDSAALLAQFGRRARMQCYNNEDARNLINTVLTTLKAESTNPRAKALGDVGQAAGGTYLTQKVGSLIQDVALTKILEKPAASLEKDLADFGCRALDHCEDSKAQRAVGHEVLRGIRRHSQSPSLRKLARVVDQATGQRLHNGSAAGAHYEAFQILQNPPATETDRLLAAFGLAAQERGQDSDDSRLMGQVVLEALKDTTQDRVKQKVLASLAQDAASQTDTGVAVSVQTMAFDLVEEFPTAPAPQSDQSLDPTVLEKRVAVN